MMDPESHTTVPSGSKARHQAEQPTSGIQDGAHGVFTWLWLVFAYVFWFVAMAGISAAQHRCSNGPEPYGPAYFATRSVLPDVSCSRVFRFMWWTLWLDFVTLILVTLVLASKALHNARSMAVGFLAIATVMLMISADKFLNLMDIAYGNDILYADRAAFAGYIICSVFNFCLLYMVGVDNSE